MRYVIAIVLIGPGGWLFMTSLDRLQRQDRAAALPLAAAIIMNTAALAIAFWPKNYMAEKRRQQTARRQAEVKAAQKQNAADALLNLVDDAVE